MMKVNKHIQHLIELNLSILFISTSGALGRYIDLPVPLTIASRALLAALFIYIFCRLKSFSLKIKKEDRRSVLLSGVFMALHWITYFYALKLSSVAIGMLSLFTYPIITAFLEPLLLKTKLQKFHIWLGVLVLIGLYFLVPELNLQHDHTKAIALGVLSAVFYSLRNIVTKTKVESYNGSILMFYQLVVISIILSPFYFFADIDRVVDQLPGLLLLAIVTTAIGHTWFVYSFKHFSVTSVSIISSSQPVYGIIIGIIFLKEYPELNTIFGGLIIVASVILESVVSYRKQVKKNS